MLIAHANTALQIFEISNTELRKSQVSFPCRSKTILFADRKPDINRGKDSPTHAASNSRSPFPHLCTKKVVSHMLHLQQGRVTISTSPFKSPYHGKAENDIS